MQLPPTSSRTSYRSRRRIFLQGRRRLLLALSRLLLQAQTIHWLHNGKHNLIAYLDNSKCRPYPLIMKLQKGEVTLKKKFAFLAIVLTFVLAGSAYAASSYTKDITRNLWCLSQDQRELFRSYGYRWKRSYALCVRRNNLCADTRNIRSLRIKCKI